MNVISIEENKNNQVKKANTLIEAKGALSSTAQKMLVMLVSMVRTDDSEFQEYALSINDYFSQVDSSSKNVEFAKERALELMRNPFELKKGIWYNWCSKVDITKVDGYIVFSIHSDLKPYLLGLQGNFTKYDIVNILALRGDYTPRLYEYFLMKFNQYKSQYKKQHGKTPKSFTFELKIDWLRDSYKIPDSYRYNDIKRQVIEKAKKQFKERTNIKFEYKEQKIGRKVDRLIVTIENNNKGSNDYLHSQQSFIDHMRKYHINDDILHAKDKNTKKEMIISVSETGKLYDKFGKSFDARRSKEMWETLYKLACENKLLILKQGRLF